MKRTIATALIVGAVDLGKVEGVAQDDVLSFKGISFAAPSHEAASRRPEGSGQQLML